MESGFIRSKVARRIVLLFVASALIPVVVLAVLSFRQIDETLRDQQYEQLREFTKSYGMSLLDRLSILKAEIEWADPTDPDSANLPPVQSREGFGFSSLSVVDVAPNADIAQRIPGMSGQPDSTLDALLKGETVMVTHAAGSKSPSVRLIRLLAQQADRTKLLVADVELDFLFPEVDPLHEDTQVCVLNDREQRIFCSPSDFRPSEEAVRLGTSSISGTALLRQDNGKERILSFWSIFLDSRFFVPDWTVIVEDTKADALAPLKSFQTIFGLVLALTIATVSLLSLMQVRRNLVPLERIMEGIRRISSRQFDQPVIVQSKDEFQELATSVNQMAGTIHRQFQVLSTLAEIDRLILSSLKVEDIIRIVLSRTKDVIPLDGIKLAIADPNLPGAFRLYSEPDPLSGTLEISGLTLSPEARDWLGTSGYRTLASHSDHLDLRSQTQCSDAARLLLLPLTIKDDLAAIICLSYQDEAILADGLPERARDFANRVSVALANASAEEELYELAHYDSLTTLPNRLLFRDRLRQAVATAARQGTLLTIFFVDLDRFKYVNDSLGHLAGDRLLQQVAARFAAAVREEDTVARLGGDEFVIMVQQTATVDESLSLNSAIARKLLDVFTHPFQIDDREIYAGASIGIACYPSDGDSPTDLLKNADAAMYHAKALGKANYQFYSSGLNERALARLEMENDLRRALEHQEFELHFQPKVRAEDHRILGAEALVRWNHPDKGRVSPLDFIPLCEELGLIVPLGNWIIENACSQLSDWIARGIEPVRVAINLSPLQFRQPDLLATVRAIIERTGVPAQLLEFEITESAAMEDVSKTIDTLNRLREMGIHISLDDFGTGFSSLNQLKELPLNRLKIDQSFVRQLAKNTRDKAIVESIITLAHTLEFSVVAEGVADEEQASILKDLRCDDFQGYLFSPPVPASAFLQMLNGAPQEREPLRAAG